MRIVGIYGSPRAGGNTDKMLDAFLEGARQEGALVSPIYVRKLAMQGCLGCGGCDETGQCVVKDDMQNVYPLLEAAQGIVLASPVYFYNLTGQVKLLIDRSQALFMKKSLSAKAHPPSGPAASKEGKKGFLLSAAATRGKKLFDCARLTFTYFMDALGGHMVGELCLRELEGKKDVEKDLRWLSQCRAEGERFARSLTDGPVEADGAV
ncbi:flavodoxin family protein [Desulfosoma caldarium]|uniref:Multimeric flavodoxin WrbA n=1 Tax=Desulfosoma caldarium TaxID=610254 RepID=A0A3N1UUX2_9BACT|nr:flavodoxin family protein [Desulfosoma caldarium]ROQ93219.1 multimeric flavodoxin WrbA [Desulfosoma caldarium]